MLNSYQNLIYLCQIYDNSTFKDTFSMITHLDQKKILTCSLSELFQDVKFQLTNMLLLQTNMKKQSKNLKLYERNRMEEFQEKMNNVKFPVAIKWFCSLRTNGKLCQIAQALALLDRFNNLLALKCNTCNKQKMTPLETI